MSESGLIFVAVTLLGCVLLAGGAGFGYFRGRRAGRATPRDAATSRYVLSKIEELAQWTSEYSGNVSQYQHELIEISDAVNGVMSSSPGADGHKILEVLEKIMQSNKSLQERLETAERQLDRQRLQIEEYMSEARTDPLTGLANRRAFDAELDRAFTAWRAGGRSYVLALIDIDYFKQVNDTHGHPAGDVVLRHVARTLATELRDAACVARYGGEEFAVLMKGPLQVAAERVDAVRKLIRQHAVAVVGIELRVTISAGLTEPRDDALIGSIIRRADEALYAAKNRGRDRVYYIDREQPLLVGAAQVARS